MAKKDTNVRGVDVYKYENQQGRSAMGDSIYEAKVAARAVSGGMLQPRDKGGAKGMIESATANHRAGIQENMGAQCHPSATLYKQNAASASDTQRNTRMLPPATVRTDFEGGRGDLIGY